MSGHPVLGDKRLVASLLALNGQLSHYVVRLLDADAGRAEPVSVAEERVFAEALRVMADRLRERVDRHAASSAPATSASQECAS